MLFMLRDCCDGRAEICAPLIEDLMPCCPPKPRKSEGKSMSERIYNVLFLCTGNTARSILAESILRKDGHRHFRAFSAGSQPKGTVNPYAIKVLNSLEYPTDNLRSKSWEEFARADAPVMDFVFTVCDNAAGEILSAMAWPAHDGALGN